MVNGDGFGTAHGRAALERDLKYYAVKYFVGDCALDRALLKLDSGLSRFKFSSSQSRRVVSNRSTLKSCYMCTIILVLVECRLRNRSAGEDTSCVK